jgi:hypothetical protein
MNPEQKKQRALLALLCAAVFLVLTTLSFASGNGNWLYLFVTLLTAGYGFRLLR